VKIWVDNRITEDGGSRFTSERLSEELGIDQIIVRRAIARLRLNPPKGYYITEHNENPRGPRAFFGGEYAWYSTFYYICERED
jgi:transcription initiation factor IIE alpha subunit